MKKQTALLGVSAADSSPIKEGLALEYGEFLVKYSHDKLRQVIITGPINDCVFHTLVHTLGYIQAQAASEKQPISILLHSAGGEIGAGFAIYDLIKGAQKKCPIDIVATGVCMSMSAIILQSARERLATPNCQFMLHQLRSGSSGQETLAEQRDSHVFKENLQIRLNRVLARRTKKTEKQIDKLTDRRDYFIGAEEALGLNLIDRIV